MYPGLTQTAILNTVSTQENHLMFPSIRLTLLSAVIAVLLMIAGGDSHAQAVPDTTRIYKIETRDGNSFLGKIKAVDAEKVVLVTDQFGELNIKQSDIKSLVEVDTKEIMFGEHWFPNPQAARYFWMPNGYGLRQGEGYYQNVWVLFNQISVGVSDHFTIGVGTVPLFLFGAGDGTPFWITPKVSIPLVKDKVNLGVGILYLNLLGFSDDFKGVGLAYGTITFGSRDKNVSLGLGYGFFDGQLSELPVVSLGFMKRISRYGYILSENYLFPGDAGGGLISFGGRRIVRKVGIDFGLFAPISTDIGRAIFIPWLGITASFGKPANNDPR